MSMSSDVEALSNHVALPAKLPGCQDSNLNEIEIQLIRRLLTASDSFLNIGNSQDKEVLSSLHRSLSLTLFVHANGGLSRSDIISALQGLNDHEFVLFHITEQNAGITVTLQNSMDGENLLFEIMEASPKCQDVLASSNALIWKFPSFAVTIPKLTYNEFDLKDELANFLVRASGESVKHVAAHTNKSQALAYESRDSVDPVIISGILVTILKSGGTESYPTPLIKRIRDDVCWDGTGINPWRRSPMWLLLRVAIERYLCAELNWEIGQIYYKVLMCLFHSQFLLECTKSSQIRGDLLQHLIKKLVIRIDKLHAKESTIKTEFLSQFIELYNALEKNVHVVVECAEKRLSDITSVPCNPDIRGIPFRAEDKFCKLQLLNSNSYIKKVLDISRHKIPSLAFQRGSSVNIQISKFQPNMSTLENLIELAKLESDTKNLLQQHQSGNQSHESYDSRIHTIADLIKVYVETVGNSYDDNPEQKSRMLLLVLELWVELDKCAVQSFNLLKKYSPGISQEITNVLLLSCCEDLERLHRVQTYLINRHNECSNSSITLFIQPHKDCFAVQYYDNLSKNSIMKQSLNQIEADAQRMRAIKKNEWQELSKEFQSLEDEELSLSHETINGEHDRRRCTKCYKKRVINRFDMKIHEWPLPSDINYVKSIMFELHCPAAFSVYRDISWTVFADLISTSSKKNVSCSELLLQNYYPLYQYANPPKSFPKFTLASAAKPFTNTHFARVKFPVRESDICLPNGAKFQYYDSINNIWPDKLRKVSYAHHCRLVFPKNSPYSSFSESLGLKSDVPGPSSYSIVASDPKCPDRTRIQEFLSMQTLLSGYEHRWIQILIELGSSNINFSTESATFLMNHLILQVGPRDDNDIRGIIHRIFLDQSFCDRLIFWIKGRLEEISSSVRKREVFLMEILVNLAVRLFELGGQGNKEEGIKILTNAREITLSWLSELKNDIKIASSTEITQKLAYYIIWAALLCRRTFIVFLGSSSISHSLFTSYLESSICLQENLNDSDSNLPLSLEAALHRDTKMVWNLRHTLRSSLNMKVLVSVILAHMPSLALPIFSDTTSIEFHEAPRDWWLQIITEESENFKQQNINLHLLTGHLLVDGKPIGKLSKEWRESRIYKRIFGTEEIQIWPSHLLGMDYVLNQKRHNYEVHFGTRGGENIIQAISQYDHLELLPSEIFLKNQISDLPSFLVSSCAHWLNFKKKRVEIRQISDPWKLRPTDWTIDLKICIATSFISNKKLFLVDPYSRPFKIVTKIFQGFEKPSEILMMQGEKGSIRVVFPRLELKFHVNENRYFECPQLGAEIDPNQDIRTWYGLKNKLVLRCVVRGPASQKSMSGVGKSHKLNRRIVLVPLGKINYKKSGINTEVSVTNNGSYARFIVNEILGRIETVDLGDQYLKAFYHAVTSRLIPDPLTGRTGTEEAIHCLNLANCQPAVPLLETQKSVLRELANLTPCRNFYPRHMKMMQETSWNKNLTTTIQYDGYRAIIEKILEKSQHLSKFFDGASGHEQISTYSADILNKRNIIRRDLYTRRQSWEEVSLVSRDNVYSGHDIKPYVSRLANVQKCILLIQNWSQFLPTTKSLGKILEGWSSFQGFSQSTTEFSISDLMDMDIRSHWGSLVNTMRSIEKSSKYKLMFLLGIISFHKNVNMNIITSLIAFAISNELKVLEPPNCLFYHNYKNNELPTVQILLNLLRNAYEFEKGSEQELQALKIAENALKQWPCAEPDIIQCSKFPSFNAKKVKKLIYPEWLRIFQNYELSNYISQVQIILNKLHCVLHKNEDQIDYNFGSIDSKFEILERDSKISAVPVLIGDLLSSDIFCQEPESTKFHSNSNIGTSTDQKPLFTWSSLDFDKSNVSSCYSHLHLEDSSQEVFTLRKIVDNLSASNSIIDQKYAVDLSESLDAFQNKSIFTKMLKLPKIIPQNCLDKLLQAIEDADEIVSRKLKYFQDCCDKIMPARSKWLKQAGLWPCITPISLLETLRSTLSFKFGLSVKEYIINYAISITNLQRLHRILDAITKLDNNRASEELKNLGHENWNPMIHPDWLLLEIDGNFLIRPGQIDVARETIFPTNGKNSVLQMNMGQGKTSCIMPMVAASLADGVNLVRVIVPKPLLTQTILLLQTRLGGLVGRIVKHVPFNRKLSKYQNIAENYLDQLQQIQKVSGIIVTLPEHILSFKLSVNQALSDGRINQSRFMSEAQNWILEKSRDIIDECDEILSIRTQLIYPSGTQKTIDGHPYRWEIVETLLQLVKSHINSLEIKYPQSITISRLVDGGFPLFSFVKAEAEESLISKIVDDICSGRSQIIPKYSSNDQLDIKNFISNVTVSDEVLNKIDLLDIENPINRQALYLLRGLIAHGILTLTLKKRWNVQYGLHPLRDPIAVPYYAKGCPSDQSEWGHPDVAIILTCLAFYFEGISSSQLCQTLKQISQVSDPIQAYNSLIQGNSSLPDSFEDWNNINLEDDLQLNELWRYLGRSIHVINFFLNKFVFPRYAKQFEHKIQATGWDIPACVFSSNTQGTRTVTSLTTGFSGTNDWKRLLPLTISQQDLPSLLHTNAEVLIYLLQKRNLGYYYAANSSGGRISELELLKAITDCKISVFLDAGALIMEMDNQSLVRAWLEIDLTALAAFYFDKDNKPQILYRNGSRVPFHSSTFSDNLENCLVYLDQIHTRGTDLKLPPTACGALTLGPNQTKDVTVQAAMRLRQLGTTQSVKFFAPPEVHQSILNLQGKDSTAILSSVDVVSWLLKQSCHGIEQLLPLYFMQGYDFCNRLQAALTYPNIYDSTSRDRQDFLSVIQPIEDCTLVELYGLKKKYKGISQQISDPDIISLLEKLKEQCKDFIDTGNRYYSASLNEAEHEVEQEREVAYEVEIVQQLQIPTIYYPLTFPGLHKDILNFVMTGKTVTNTNGYESAFDFIGRTSIGKNYKIEKLFTSQKLFVSTEFGRTVNKTKLEQIDHLHRPVHWILWSNISKEAIVIIPEEAEIIIPKLRKDSHPVHLLTYASPVTRKMLIFNDFMHYNLPPLSPTWCAPLWLRIEVGILSGRFYFDFLEYIALLEFLGVREVEGKLSDDKVDAIMHPSDSLFNTLKIKNAQQSFASKPLHFLQEWLALRGRGIDFSHTPMGFICKGRPAQAHHPFFKRLQHNPIYKNPISYKPENSSRENYQMSTKITDQEEYDFLFDFENANDDLNDESSAVDIENLINFSDSEQG